MEKHGGYNNLLSYAICSVKQKKESDTKVKRL